MRFNELLNIFTLVSIIPVNYAQAEVCCAMIRSIKSITYPNYEIIIVDNANFLMSDTAIYSNYEVLKTPEGVEADVVPKFSKDNKWLGLTEVSEVVFHKIK